MSRNVLVVHPDHCTGCRICEQYCSWKHVGAVNPARARLTVRKLPGSYINLPIACSQCEDAECIAVCPDGAITRDPVTGGLVFEPDACTSCHLCAESCPNGCINFDPELDTPLLCDLCDGSPQCVAHCPEAALEYRAIELVEAAQREGYVRYYLGERQGGR